MTSENETFDDIVGDMRAQHRGCENCDLGEMTSGDFLGIIDRIDSAHKREVKELRSGIAELLDTLQSIYDEECYRTDEVYDKWRNALEGAKDEAK